MKFRKKAQEKTLTTNLAGGIAHIQSPELELVSLILTSFVEDKFYESASEQLIRLKALVAQIPDKKFIAQALIYARNEFGMRSVTHAGTIELLAHAKGEPWLKNAIANVIRRPDDMLEMVGYWTQNAPDHEKVGLPSALRKGITLALDKFDAYQFAKYKGSKSDVKMVDIFNLVHPKPKTAERAELYKSLMKGELKSTDTWEAKLSKAGQDGETDEQVDALKGNAWKELIATRKLGYFALLRNLRNIIEQSPDSIPLACEMLKDTNLIKKSLVLPFRYMTAIEALNKLAQEKSNLIPDLNRVIIAINEAMGTACNNVPKFDGKTVVVLDVSGSMIGKPLDIGALFSGVILKANPSAMMMLFCDSAKYVMVNTQDSLGTIVNTLKNPGFSGGTDFHAIFRSLDQAYDRIIILSDMQGWMGYQSPKVTFEQYKKRYNCDPFVYSVDLAGHGTLQLPENKVACLAGFSEKMFDTIKMLEQDKNALINKIKTIEI